MQGTDTQRRARLLIASSFGVFLVSLILATWLLVSGPYPPINVMLAYAGCVLAAVALLVFRWADSVPVAGAVLCAGSLLLAALQAYFRMGLTDPVLLWALVIPWLAALLIRPPYGLGFAGLTAGLFGGYYLLAPHDYLFRAFGGADPHALYYALCASLVALFLGALGGLYERQARKTAHNARRWRAEADAAVAQANAQSARILATITDGFAAIDAAWCFTDLNPQAEHLLQASKDALLGQDARTYFSDAFGEASRARLLAVAEAREGATLETYHEPLGRWFTLHIHPAEDGLSVYFNDITARKAYEKNLIEAKEEAEHLAQLKSTLLANMSHEIRTPLTSIIGFAGILAQEAAGEHQQFAALIERNGQRLMGKLNAVLDLAQLERGFLHYNPIALNVADEVGQLAQVLQPLADENGLYLRVECEADDTTADLDRGLLSRVLTNVIGNAIKYTNEGGVVVTVEGDEAHVTVRVADTGVGISAAFMPHLFDEFQREAGADGHGLGLAISRRLVHTMGGTIAVESEKGVGSTFTVCLPRTTPPSIGQEDFESPKAA